MAGTDFDELPEDLHEPGMCQVPCSVHSPSDHPLREHPLLWNGDTEIFERRCGHGHIHPDPDSLAYVSRINPEMAGLAAHSCIGCCHHGCKVAADGRR